MKTTSKFQKDIAEMVARMGRISREIQAYQWADRLLDGVDLSDCSYVSASSNKEYKDNGDEEVIHVTLTLDADRADSKLAHKLAQKLGLKFNKKQSYYKDSLELTATIDGNIHEYPVTPAFILEIDGSVPKTCKLVTREIPLTDEEIEQARKDALENVKLVRIEREIICKE